MKPTMRFLFVALLLVQAIGTAWADCPYNGKWYKAGTVLGDRVCAQDGTWKPR